MAQGIIRQAEQYGLDIPEPEYHGMTEAQVADMLRPPRIHQGTMDRRVSRETLAEVGDMPETEDYGAPTMPGQNTQHQNADVIPKMDLDQHLLPGAGMTF